MYNGIEVTNKNGTISYGKSRAAGRKALLETSLSRFILPLPCIGLPAIFYFILESMGLLPSGPLASKILESVLIIFSLTFALPFSIALFKQQAVLKDS